MWLVGPDWNYRVAFLFRHRYITAENECILTTAADILFDSRIIRYFELLGTDEIRLISFGLKQYPPNFNISSGG